MLTIYGCYRSRASRNYWMVNELGLPFQSVPVIQAYRLDNPMADDAPFNTLSPEFLAINPMGQIPSIKDGDFVMNESLAINQYLARKHGGPLAGQSAEEEGLIAMWSLWAAAEVEPHSLKISQTHGRGEQDSEAGKAAIAVVCRSLKRPMDMLEKHFAANEYLVGGRFTVADINAAEVLRYAQPETAMFNTRPSLKAWIERCQARPAHVAMMATRSEEKA